MKKQTLPKLLICAILCAAAVCDVQAQPNGQATAPAAGGGFGRGFGRGGFGFARSVPAGPPAPVPPEVAIARPTQAEVAKMNADLKQFIQQSPDKELLQKYESLLTVNVPRANSCIVPTSGGVRGPRHQAFVDEAKTNDFDILFDGDSITDFWRDPASRQGGAEVFKKYFGDMKIANFAVAGDTTQGLLWGLQDGEGQGHKPKVVMLMIGTNNTGGFGGGAIPGLKSPRVLARMCMSCARTFRTPKFYSWRFSRAAPARMIPIASRMRKPTRSSPNWTTGSMFSS